MEDNEIQRTSFHYYNDQRGVMADQRRLSKTSTVSVESLIDEPHPKYCDDETSTWQNQLTVRAIIVGLIIGVLMCFINMYFGLMTGWVTMGSLQSALLGYGMFHLGRRINLVGFEKPMTVQENIVITTTAVATATMPLAAGFVGVIPALSMLKEEEGHITLSFGQALLWTMSIALFGLFMAVPLRKQTILVEKLRFPSGTATAEIIEVLHGSGDVENSEMKGQWQVLGWSFLASSLYGFLAFYVPVLRNIPVGSWIGLPILTEWQWTFNPALAYVGQGMIMGLKPGLSAMAGSITAWAIIGPIAKSEGWAPGKVTDWKNGAQGWLMWIALIVMLSESVVSLSITSCKIVRSYYIRYTTGVNNDTIVDNIPESEQVPMSWWLTGLVTSTAMCMAIDVPLFDLSVGHALVAVSIGCVVSVVAVRALGDTDLNPVSGIGKVSQVVFGVLNSDNLVANIIGGGVAEAGAQQAGDVMQAYKSAYLLSGSPKANFLASIIGTLVSVPVAVVAYDLYREAYNIPFDTKPPAAEIWVSMARLMRDGVEGLAPNVGYFLIVFAFFGAAIPLIHEFGPTRVAQYLPSATAFAIGMYIQPYWVMPRVVGALLAYGLESYAANKQNEKSINYVVNSNEQEREALLLDESHESTHNYVAGMATTVIVVASGFVLGDGITSICTATLKSFGVQPLTCWACPPDFCGSPC
eukprot:CFRG3054T1